MLAKFPGAPVPSAGRIPRPSELRPVVPRFFLLAENPAAPQLISRGGVWPARRAPEEKDRLRRSIPLRARIIPVRRRQALPIGFQVPHHILAVGSLA
jgi:hypothetical protein